MRGPVVLLSLAGCSLLTNLGDLQGGVDGGSASDGGSGVCTGTHLLCENFDHGDAWASTLAPSSNYATMSITTDESVSPPGSLLVEAGIGDSYGVLVGELALTPPADFSCSVQVRTEGVPTGFYTLLSPIILRAPSVAKYEIAFRGYLDKNSGPMGWLDEHIESDAAADNEKSLGATVENDGAWHKITMTVHLGASPTATMDLSPGGYSATIALTPPSDVTSIAFAIGFANGGSAGGWVAHFDDAVCDKL